MTEPAPDEASAEPTPQRRAGLGPAERTLIVFAAAAIVVAGLSIGRDILAPVLLAAVIVVTVHPVRRPLLRHGWPRWLATTTAAVLAYAVLAAIAVLVVFAVAQFGRLILEQRDGLADAQQSFQSFVVSLGFQPVTAAGASSWLDPKTLLGLVTSIGDAVAHGAIAFFFVLAYILFMVADAAGASEIVARFGRTHGGVIDALARCAHGIRSYLLVNTVFGLIVALLDGVVLWALNVPGALVWVVLAFVTNYIPSVGFVIGLIPPAILALVTGGWVPALAVVAAYCVINLTLQELVQPRFVSGAVHLNLTLTFFSVVFWAAVIGPIGALLSIPLTLFARTLLIESDPAAGWSRWLTGDRRESSR